MDLSTLTVRCGEWNTDIKDEKSVDIEAKSIMIHPEFQNETNYNDFAIIGGFQLLDLIITELKSHMTC